MVVKVGFNKDIKEKRWVKSGGNERNKDMENI